MIEKIFELMKDYDAVAPYGKVELILLSDSSGRFYFPVANVGLKFKNLDDAILVWNKLFKIS